MRCNAAAKGIQGDGKVQLCVSKEQFDAINDKAGDSLVRTPPLSSSPTVLPRRLHPQNVVYFICQLYLS